MRGLTSTPLLVALLVLALAGAAGLGLRAASDLRVTALAAPATATTIAGQPADTPPAAPPTAAQTARTAAPRATGSPVRRRPTMTSVALLPPAAPPPPRMGLPALARPTPGRAVRPVPVKAQQPVVYAAIGASDSVGVGADDPATQSWVADLARRLPPGSSVHNFGVSGILLGPALQAELPRALAVRPTLVTVWLAVNDLKGQVPLATYEQQLATLLKALRTQTTAMVFVGNVPRLSLLPAFAAVPAAQLDAVVAQWNAAIAAVAARYGAVVVDLYAPSLTLASHPEYVSSDGFHPSTVGYQNEAQTFWQAITRHRAR